MLAAAVPARAGASAQSLDVTRPVGQLSIEVRGDHIVVTDTRADDPGWNVSGVAGVVATTEAFADGSGFVYRQRVTLHDGVATAPAQHGLGIAHLTAARALDTVTITII